MQRNVKFSYLYRDAGNYKKWADVVFSNPEGLSIDLVNKALKHAFMQDGLFIAHQIRIPEVFLFARGDATSDDHCFHEFGAVEPTAALPNDGYSRSISEFIAEANSEALKGWVAFDPNHGATAL
jgi:hypothetical protein